MCYFIPEFCATQSDQSHEVDQENTATPIHSVKENTGPTASSTSAIHKNRKRKDKLPLVETEVRRRYRLHKLNNGFKKSVCKDRNCLPCTTLPPPIPTRVVKNLNTSFCKVNEQDTAEEKIKNGGKKLKTTGNKTRAKESKSKNTA